MSDAWAEYLEALRVLRRAPQAARGHLDRIDAEAAQAIRAADDALRSTVARREALELRVGTVGEMLRTALTEREIPAAGAAPVVRLPTPGTLDEALATVDRIERQVRDNLERLDAARSLAVPPATPRRWWRYALAGAGALALIAAIVLFAIS